MEVIPVAAYTCDAAGRNTYFNPLAVSIWGRAAKLRDLSNRYCGSHKLFGSNGTPMPHNKCWMALALLEGKDYIGRELVIERPDGSRVQAMAHASPVRNNQGQIIGAVNIIVDKTATPYDGALAMIEVALAVLTGLTWPTSTFD